MPTAEEYDKESKVTEQILIARYRCALELAVVHVDPMLL